MYLKSKPYYLTLVLLTQWFMQVDGIQEKVGGGIQQLETLKPQKNSLSEIILFLSQKIEDLNVSQQIFIICVL